MLRSLGRLALAAAVLAGWGIARAQVGDAEVVFGMVGPFSGAAKEMGKEVRTGIEVAFAAQNEAGGVHGRKLRLVAVDDGFEPARTAAAMRDLVEVRKVFGILGNVGTANASVAVPYANEKGVLFFGAVSGASLLRHNPPDRYVFNFRASYAEETAAMVRYLVEVRRIPPGKIAVFAQDDAFGDAGFEGVARIIRQYRRDPAKVLRVRYKRNTADVEDAVRAVAAKAKDVGAVIMVATYKASARFIERLHDAGLGKVVFTNVSDVDSNALADELAQLGPGYAEGVVVTQVVPPPTGKATDAPQVPGAAQEARRRREAQLPLARGLGSRRGSSSRACSAPAARSRPTRSSTRSRGSTGSTSASGRRSGSARRSTRRRGWWGTVLEAKGALAPLELL